MIVSMLTSLMTFLRSLYTAPNSALPYVFGVLILIGCYKLILRLIGGTVRD